MLVKLAIFFVGVLSLSACGSNTSSCALDFDVDKKSVSLRDISGNGFYDVSTIDTMRKYIAVGRSRITVNGSQLPLCGYTFYFDDDSWFVKFYIYDLDETNLKESLKRRVEQVLVLFGFTNNSFVYDLEGLSENYMSVTEYVEHPKDKDLGLRYELKKMKSSGTPELEILIAYTGSINWKVIPPQN